MTVIDSSGSFGYCLSGCVNLIKKKAHSLGADWTGQNRSKAPCHGIDTHDASACRFLIEGGDALALEPPPGADSYLFSGAPVERRSWRAEGQRPFAPVPTAVGA